MTLLVWARYAVQAAGFLQRPSEDIDLFTVWERRGEFETAADAIVNAYLAAGLSVEAERRHDTFTRLTVSDGVQTAKVELGVDMRANEPVRISIGPVLHPDDAVANKMGALYERALARDFIDIDAHRDTLSEADPGKDRIDRGEALPVWLRVGDVDAARQAANMTANDLAVAHQPDAGWVAFADRAEIGLLEIAVDPKRVGVDERDLILPDGDVVAELRQQVCHPAVDWGADLRALEVHFCSRWWRRGGE